MPQDVLIVSVLGPLRATWQGREITPAGPRSQAVLAVLALAGRPLPRALLAERVWGPGRLRNLRQELYKLRQLPGAADWLVVDGAGVGLRAQVDRDDARALAAWAPGVVLLEGLPLLGSPALEDWLDGARAAAEQAREARRAALEDELVAALAVAAPAPLGAGLLAALVGLPAAVVRGALEGVPRVGGALAPRHVRPALAALSAEERARIALALLAAGGPELDAGLRARLLDAPAPAPAAPLGGAPVPAPGWRALVAALEGDAEAQCRHYQQWMDDRQQAGDEAGRAAAEAALHAHALRSQAPPLLLESARLRFLGGLRAHELEAAEAAADELFRLAERHGDPDARGRARLCLGELHRRRGDATEAARWFTAARLVPGTTGRTAVVALNGAGAVAAMQGRLDEALQLHEEALARAREAGLRAEVPRLLNSVGSDAERLGRDRRAAQAFREAAALALLAGQRTTWVMALRNAALAGIRGGRLGDARQDLRALQEPAGGLAPRDALLIDEIEADLARALGQLDRAAAVLLRLEERAIAQEDGARVRLARLNRAALQLQRGEAAALPGWQAGVAALLADGDYGLAAECIADVLAWAAVPAAVRRARQLRPTDAPQNARHALVWELSGLRLDPEAPWTALAAQLATLPPTSESARGWALLVERGAPGAAAGLQDCLLALGVGLTADHQAALERHHRRPVGFGGPPRPAGEA